MPRYAASKLALQCFHIQMTLVLTTVFLPKILLLNRFAVIKKLDMDPSKASITDTFEQFL